jgi:F0F1-type ATP synthase membrane subunit a
MIIRRIGVLSAAKIGGILGAALGLLAGLMFSAISGLGGLAAAVQQGGEPGAGWLLGLGAAAIIVMPILYGMFGFIGGAIQAFIYNLAARFVGGLEVETT